MEAVKLGKFIEEELEVFCRCCCKDELRIYYKLAFDENDRTTRKIAVLTCENLDKCTRLYQYLKERQNG